MSKSKEQNFLIQHIISNVINFIAEDNNISTEKAMQIFFSSDLSKKIEDIETGYYLESPSYIYELLRTRERQ